MLTFPLITQESSRVLYFGIFMMSCQERHCFAKKLFDNAANRLAVARLEVILVAS